MTRRAGPVFSDDFVETIKAHRSQLRSPISIIEALTFIGCSQIIVSPLDGALLWKRIRIETGITPALNLFGSDYVGFRNEFITVLWPNQGGTHQQHARNINKRPSKVDGQPESMADNEGRPVPGGDIQGETEQS